MDIGIFTAAWVIWLCCTFSTGRACEHGWLTYDRHCYKIYSTPVTYLRASRICNLEGSKLASVSSENILTFLTEHLATEEANKFWVGLQRIRNNLEWNDGTPANNQSWVEQILPTDFYHPSDSNYCYAYNGARVSRLTCISSLGFVCQRNKTGIISNLGCKLTNQNSFIGEVTGKCLYTLGPTKNSNAEKLCEDSGGSFFDIDEILKDGISTFHAHHLIANDGLKFWTALTWDGKEIVWRSGDVLQPDYAIPFNSGEGNCVTVLFNFTNMLETHLYQTECDDEAYVVCGSVVVPSPTITATIVADQPDQRECPPGYNWKEDRITGYCYWETSYETSRLSWDDARRYCQSFGGDLASFHSTEEEKIGLSFQYGSLAHPYWIGLKLDVETETYKWSDGSPLNYENWAPNHPDHKDKRLRCVSMNAEAKHWVSSLCGILSWFVCKAPKQLNPRPPVIPTPTPMVQCEGDDTVPRLFYFQGYCYNAVNLPYSWHRARLYCENEGSTLVSIHSDEEIGFLLRMLYDDKSLSGNRVWIGLNSLSADGSFRWTDWSPLDFTYWNDNEPNNFQNQEKCCNMYAGNGLWNDENCNANMGFICKRQNDTSVTPTIPTTQDPRIGNCKKDWFAHHDRCYYLVGEKMKDRANWSTANEVCQSYNGYLASIRSSRDQAFLGYLLQRLKEDTWLGLHDTIQSGSYYWVDNSDVSYTNWAPGEPSFYGIKEDCVKMVYGTVNSGRWKDEECNVKLPYICQTQKDPNLPEPSYNRGTGCIHPEGWLKLDNLCFKMFYGTTLTWSDAETACRRNGAHLVSVTDTAVQAVVSYLAAEVNETFWIGLQYKKSSQKISWLNERPVTFSKWDSNEPGVLYDGMCFASSPKGFWKRNPCSDQLSFLCQVTTGKPPRPVRYTGNCPKTSAEWTPGEGSYCYILGLKRRLHFFAAGFECYKAGSNLISLHSMDDVNQLQKFIPSDARNFFIGLIRNTNGGFVWTDHSAVDFINWDHGQPENSEDHCVKMSAETLKWQVAPCMDKSYYICASKKDTPTEDVPESAKLSEDSSGGLSTGALTGIIVCLLLAVIVIVAAVLYYKPIGKTRLRVPTRQQSVSFENALYNVDSASMEFQEEKESTFKL